MVILSHKLVKMSVSRQSNGGSYAPDDVQMIELHAETTQD